MHPNIVQHTCNATNYAYRMRKKNFSHVQECIHFIRHPEACANDSVCQILTANQQSTGLTVSTVILSTKTDINMYTHYWLNDIYWFSCTLTAVAIAYNIIAREKRSEQKIILNAQINCDGTNYRFAICATNRIVYVRWSASSPTAVFYA